jgi:hypothetical protein
MSIALEYIDFVVPIRVIHEKYPGGWAQCLRDHAKLVGGQVWYDEHLFRDGAMSPSDVEAIVSRWEGLGFEPFEQADGMRKWKDVCVVESLLGGPTLPCDWISIDKETRTAFLAGTEPGGVAGPGAR